MTEATTPSAERGTIVYVHGASDRSAGVAEHVERIERSLDRRGARIPVVVADWGDRVGPDLARICESLPDTPDPSRPCEDPPIPGRLETLRAVIAAGFLASQFLRRSRSNRLKVRATDMLLPFRDDLMHRILGVADVLVYQRAGDAIRDVVRETLASVPDGGRPLIAVGNSLGGIILFDLLREPDAPRPDLFVTVGSQAPVLQSIGALGADVAQPFTPWLNIYDRRDLFGFTAHPVWPLDGVEDHRVDLEKGFPEVHGPEYLSHPPVYDAILGHPAVSALLGGSGG